MQKKLRKETMGYENRFDVRDNGKRKVKDDWDFNHE